ncbi:MAG: hypothetical protein LC676_09150 [Loktanella sp.]|nr:hypothetical protein [Loktanella sp.]
MAFKDIARNSVALGVVAQVVLFTQYAGTAQAEMIFTDTAIADKVTLGVNFNTSKSTRYHPRAYKSRLNWIITDSDWEDKLADQIEDHLRVLSYAKNHNLGLEIPYLVEGEPRTYLPNFLIRLDTHDLTTLVVEVKGYRGHDAMFKADTMRGKWVPAFNRLGAYGRWGFAELRSVHYFSPELNAGINAILKGEPA